MIKQILISALILTVTLFALPLAAPVLADHEQGHTSIIDPGSEAAACEGISGKADCGDTGFFSNLVTTIVSLLTFIVGGISVIMLVIGGIRYATSAGDANAVNGAKNTILYAIIGLAVAATAFVIVGFVIGRL